MLGTVKERGQVRAPTDSSGLADLRLRDWRGKEVRLGDFWSENPAVLVFLRHYG